MVKKSKKYSFVGWSLKTWFLNHKKMILTPFTVRTLKELIKLLVSFATSWLISSNPYLETLGTVLGKFVLDCAEYYLKEY